MTLGLKAVGRICRAVVGTMVVVATMAASPQATPTPAAFTSGGVAQTVGPGSRSALVITINLKADPTKNLPATTPDRTPTEVSADVVDASRPWFQQASHGMFSGFFALKRGPVTVQTTTKPCTTAWLTEIGDQADKAIHDHEPGIVPKNQNAVVYYFGTVAACTAHSSDPSVAPDGAAGWGDLPAQSNRVWLNGFSDLGVAVHELGHNLGLTHSSSLSCKDTHGTPVPLSSDCTADEYGDAFSSMGGGLSDAFSPAQLAQLGWNTGRVAGVTAGSATTGILLTSAEVDTAGSTQAVRLVDGGTILWLEYRRPASPTTRGFPYQTTYTDGLLVRREQTAPDGPRSYLLSMNRSESPSTFDTIAHPNMVVGQTWADPLGTMQITLDNAGTTTAHVTIRPAAQPTTRVPDLQFRLVSDAQNAITAAHLVTGTVTTEVDLICDDTGHVLRQTPAAGKLVASGGKVNFVVAAPGPSCPVGE